MQNEGCLEHQHLKAASCATSMWRGGSFSINTQAQREKHNKALAAAKAVLARNYSQLALELLRRVRKICDTDLISGIKHDGVQGDRKAFIRKNIQRVIRRSPVLLPLLRPIALGNTVNNRNQFKFFQNHLSSIGIRSRLAILDGNPWGGTLGQSIIPVDELNDDIDSLTCELTSCLSDFSVTEHHILSVLKGVFSYLLYSISFELIALKHIPYIVVSNDHTPSNLGFILAAKDRSIDRIYLQHSFVTSDFPELDFEISILGNTKSIEVYGASYKSEGNKVLVIPREPFMNHEKYESGYAYPGDGDINITVCLYLTANTIECNLREALDNLTRNRSVGKLLIKPHPNKSYSKDIELLLEEFGGSVIFDHYRRNHIALAGNSSVCLDLAGRVIKCFQCFSLDAYPEDYYGFVSGGLCEKVCLDDLTQDFWLGWDGQKVRAAREGYFTNTEDRIVRDSYHILNEYLKGKHGKYLHDNLTGDESFGYLRNNNFDLYLFKLNELVDRAISRKSSRKYTSALNKKTFVELYSDPSLRINYLEFAHKCRVSGIYENLLIASTYETDTGVRLYAKYKHSLWAGRHVNFDSVQNDMAEIDSYSVASCSGFVIKHSVGAIFAYAVSELFASDIAKIFGVETLSRYNIDSASNLSNLLIKFISNGYRDPRLLSYCSERLTPFEKHKLIWLAYWGNIEIDSLVDGLSCLIPKEALLIRTHSEMIEILASFMQPAVALELFSSFRELERAAKLGGINDYLLMRICKNMQVDFISKLESKLVARESYSFIRLSDGEGYAFEGYFFDHDDSSNREMHWWGCELDHSLRMLIKKHVVEAIKHANCLGVPSAFRMWRDLSPKLDNPLDSIQLRGMFSVIRGVSDLSDMGSLRLADITEEKSNQILFSNPDTLAFLCSASVGVIIVSSVDSAVFSSVLGISDYRHIRIPTHARTNNTSGYITSRTTLPYMFSAAREELMEYAKPGYLVIVSAGIIGKIFIHDASQCGAVAIDIGECADTYKSIFEKGKAACYV